MFRDGAFLQSRVIIGLAGLTLLFFAALHFVFGVSPLVTLTILLCFLIILAAAAGCALHIRQIEILEESEALDKMREKVELHIQFISEIAKPAKARLKECEAELVNHASRMTTGATNLVTTRRIIEALEERLELLTTLLQTTEAEPVIKAHEVAESKLKVKVDVIHSTVDAEVIPDLEGHLWRDTLDMLLVQVERQLRAKVEFAA